MNDNIEVVNLEAKAQGLRKSHQREFREQRNKRQSQRRGGNQRPRGGQRQQRRPRGQPETFNQQPKNNQNRRQQNTRRLLRRTGGRQERQQPQRQQQRPARIQRRQSSPKQSQLFSIEPQPNVIFKGLGDFMSDQKLREICQAYGALDMCKLDRDSFGNVKPQGIGLVRFERQDDAHRIVQELNGARIVEGSENNQSSGGQVSVKFVEPGENWYRYVNPSGVLPVQRRTPFKYLLLVNFFQTLKKQKKMIMSYEVKKEQYQNHTKHISQNNFYYKKCQIYHHFIIKQTKCKPKLKCNTKIKPKPSMLSLIITCHTVTFLNYIYLQDPYPQACYDNSQYSQPDYSSYNQQVYPPLYQPSYQPSYEPEYQPPQQPQQRQSKSFPQTPAVQPRFNDRIIWPQPKSQIKQICKAKFLQGCTMAEKCPLNHDGQLLFDLMTDNQDGELPFVCKFHFITNNCNQDYNCSHSHTDDDFSKLIDMINFSLTNTRTSSYTPHWKKDKPSISKNYQGGDFPQFQYYKGNYKNKNYRHK